MHDSVLAGVILAASAVFMALVCDQITRRAADGSLERNGMAGIRTKATRASERAWVAGHQAALPVTGTLLNYSLAGVVVVALLVWFAGDTVLPLLAGFGSVGWQLALMLVALRRANSAAREAE